MNKKIVFTGIGALVAVVSAIVVFRAVSTMKNGATPSIVDSTAISVPQAARAEKPMSEDQIASGLRKAEETIAKDPASRNAEAAYMAAGSLYERLGNFPKARENYRKVIEIFPNSANITKVQEALDDINVKELFSPEITKNSFVYEVQKGDGLRKIAKKFNTTVELITISNGLKSAAIRVGKKLKIAKSKFNIVVDKSQNILTLKADGEIFKTYRVSTGKNNSSPVGTFKITNKIVDPPWYPSAGKMIPAGDPKNVLGSRWLGISKPSYGIHGTIDPGSIGKSVTEGCVRMRNEEVEELYAIVPEGTEVVIVD